MEVFDVIFACQIPDLTGIVVPAEFTATVTYREATIFDIVEEITPERIEQ